MNKICKLFFIIGLIALQLSNFGVFAATSNQSVAKLNASGINKTLSQNANIVKNGKNLKLVNNMLPAIDQVEPPATPPPPAYLPFLPQTQFPFSNEKSEILFTQKSFKISSIDPTTLTNISASFFPGLRGANQLVVYTPLFGFRTNTNEFGTEAIVTGNTVTAISGADSIIPRNGIVISGHGAAKKWMNENMILGSKIYIDAPNNQITSYITSDSFIFGAKDKISEAKQIANYYKDLGESTNYEQTQALINQALEYLNKAEKSPQEVQKYSALAIESANNALATAIPYKASELKGVWIRPTETSKEAILATLNRIQASGINNVFLETYYHGKTIFPSETMEKYNFKKQNEKFSGIDPLKIWVEEAHKRNIKIHIWFETFYVGNQNPQNDPQSILAVKPKWANVTKRDYQSTSAVPSLSEHGGYFIDPANPEVQEFLQTLISEIIGKYHPDGINLDYIRYPQSIAAKYASYDQSNWGYTEFARNEFKNSYGIDPVEITYDDPLWSKWDKYRQDKVSIFVAKISKITHCNGVLLTAVIFPDRQKALETKQQDWRCWSYMNYVDGFTPLLLTCDPKTASVMIQDVNRNKSHNTSLYVGLFATFMGGTNEDLIRAIHESRKLNAKGVIIFDYAHLSDNYIQTLTKSAFAPQCDCESRQNKSNTQKRRLRLLKKRG